MARSSSSTSRRGTGKAGKPWRRLTAPCSAASCDITVKMVVPTFGNLVWRDMAPACVGMAEVYGIDRRGRVTAGDADPAYRLESCAHARSRKSVAEGKGIGPDRR